MSPVPEGPICISCSGSTQDVSTVCTECNHLCCHACFGLLEEGDSEQGELLRSKKAKLARKCSRCRGSDKEAKEHQSKLVSIKQEPETEEPLPYLEEISSCDTTMSFEEEETSPERMEQKQERCLKHDKDWKLYCLSCNELLCESCFLIERSHVRHQIDFIETVYLEGRTKTDQKLEQLEEKAKLLQEHAVQIDSNLEIVQEAELSVYEEIDLLCTNAKESVAKLTDNRKQTLEKQSEFPANAQKLSASLLDMIQQLPQAEFLQQQSQIEKQCDEMLGETVPRDFIEKRFDDIGCELVPPYEMETFCLDYVDTTDKQELIMVCETSWTVDLRKKDSSLFVKVTPHCEEVLKFAFKLLVVIAHEELRKTIRKTFTVQGTCKEFEIVSNDRLETGGFISENELVVEIGLRPLNALIENRLMRQQIKNTKKVLADATSSAKRELTHLDSYLQSVAVCSQFCTMYFNVHLYRHQHCSYLESSVLTDRTDHGWCLRVHQLDRNDTTSNLQVYLILHKGAPVKCQYFIEMMHSNPKKAKCKSITTYMFDKIDHGVGWGCFIERQQLLSDPEFYPSEMLCFRFGVLPIADVAN